MQSRLVLLMIYFALVVPSAYCSNDGSHSIDSNALFDAIGSNDINNLKGLLNRGADPNIRHRVGGRPALLLCAAQFTPTQMLQALLEAGADTEATDQHGETALMTAAKFDDGGIEKIRALLKSGANMEATDQHGKTALMLAATHKRAVSMGRYDSDSDCSDLHDDPYTVYRKEKEVAKDKQRARVRELLLRGAAFPTEQEMDTADLSQKVRKLLEDNKEYSRQHCAAAIGVLELLPIIDLKNIVLNQIGHKTMSEEEMQETIKWMSTQTRSARCQIL